MAIIKVGAPLAGIRGTLGGIVYSQNLAGTYAKQWAKGPNPRTPKQSGQRTFLARMPALWNALNPAERTAWGTFAALPAQDLTNPLGETYSASGYNWFCKCNIRLLRTGRATISATPSQARPSAPTINAFRVTTAGTDSNIATGGTASASTFLPGFAASRAFDGNTNSDWVSQPPAVTGWLQYVLTSTAVVRRYRIYYKAGVTTQPEDWTFERLDPGPTWVVLQTVTGFAGATPGWHDFYCPNEVTSTTYRLNISKNQGDVNAVVVMEMEYYTATVDGSVIIYPEDEFLDPLEDFDLILHIAQGATAARQTQYPGFLEVLAIQDPNRWYSLFQPQLEAIAGIIQPNRTWFARLFRQTEEGIRSAEQTAFIVTS